MKKVGDKLGMTARSRAPKDDGEFNELAAALVTHAKQLKDLEVRVTLFNGSTVKMLTDNEKLAVQEAALFGPLGVGRNGDFADIRKGRKEHEERYAAVQSELRRLADDCKRVQALVDERHKRGAEHEKLKKKSKPEEEKEEGEEREEGEEGEFDAEGRMVYQQTHSAALSALREWSLERSISHQPLYTALRALQLSFFSGGSSDTSTSVSNALASLGSLKLW